MKIEYSKIADALYVYFKEKQVTKTKEIEQGINIDLDENGHFMG